MALANSLNSIKSGPEIQEAGWKAVWCWAVGNQPMSTSYSHAQKCARIPLESLRKVHLFIQQWRLPFMCRARRSVLEILQSCSSGLSGNYPLAFLTLVFSIFSIAFSGGSSFFSWFESLGGPQHSRHFLFLYFYSFLRDFLWSLGSQHHL